MKYIDNVYNIEQQTRKLTDGRVNPSYKTEQIIFPLLIGFLLRIRSFNELNYLLKENEFECLFPKGEKLSSIDTIRDTLKVIDLEGLRSINKNIMKKAIKNKVFKDGTIDGYIVAAIDGTKIFGSKKKHCSKCLSLEINSRIHYYHSAAVMSLVGSGHNLVLDYEMYNCKIDSSKKDEGELNVSKRLLTRVISQHKSFIDIVTYDALACNSKFINHCIEEGVDTVIRVKKNNNNSIKEVKRSVNKKEVSEIWDNKSEKIFVSEEIFYMKGVDKPLRYVKFTKRKSGLEYSQILIVTTCTEMKLKTLYKIIKARWEIENGIFNTLKNEASLGHCFVHGGNAVEAILYCIFIASNLFQLFKQRRIKNHIGSQRELVRQLFKGLYLLKYERCMIFDTT
jgi:predicted transposase YbfD/YdcC